MIADDQHGEIVQLLQYESMCKADIVMEVRISFVMINILKIISRVLMVTFFFFFVFPSISNPVGRDFI